MANSNRKENPTTANSIWNTLTTFKFGWKKTELGLWQRKTEIYNEKCFSHFMLISLHSFFLVQPKVFQLLWQNGIVPSRPGDCCFFTWPLLLDKFTRYFHQLKAEGDTSFVSSDVIRSATSALLVWWKFSLSQRFAEFLPTSQFCPLDTCWKATAPL